MAYAVSLGDPGLKLYATVGCILCILTSQGLDMRHNLMPGQDPCKPHAVEAGACTAQNCSNTSVACTKRHAQPMAMRAIQQASCYAPTILPGPVCLPCCPRPPPPPAHPTETPP
jgi:hypothetical protein